MSVLPIMKTDILLTCGERTLIIDTKYYTKIMREYFGKEKLREAHLNQINTYVTQYDRDHHYNVDGMLLYAKTQDDIGDDKTIALQDGYSLYIRTLDLNTDFADIKKRLDSFIL